MIRVLKYILLVLAVFALVWVFGMRFTSEKLILTAVSIAVSISCLLAVRNKLENVPFYRMFLVVVSLALLTIPALGPREEDSFEKRKLADFPKFRISNVWKFLFGYDEYFTDRFAFRNDAVEQYGKWRMKYLKTSPMPEQVAIGKNDFLFRSNDEYIKITSDPWTEAQVDTAAMHLEIITKYFDLRGIKYYFAMIPIKERIYKEYVPSFLAYKLRFSRHAVLMEELKKHPAVRNIDCHDTLVEGRKVMETYYNTDTHWTEFGSFLGYRKIMNRVKQDFPSITPLELSDYKRDSVKFKFGDLQMTLGFSGEIVITRYYYTKIKGPELLTVDSSMYQSKDVNYSVRELSEKNKGLKLFLIRDSFSEHLRNFILHDFDRSVLAWTPTVPVTNILRESPDIVVQEMLEMFSPYLLKLPPEIAIDTAFLKTNFPHYLK